jgi:hypothetical protein
MIPGSATGAGVTAGVWEGALLGFSAEEPGQPAATARMKIPAETRIARFLAGREFLGGTGPPENGKSL